MSAVRHVEECGSGDGHRLPVPIALASINEIAAMYAAHRRCHVTVLTGVDLGEDPSADEDDGEAGDRQSDDEREDADPVLSRAR